MLCINMFILLLKNNKLKIVKCGMQVYAHSKGVLSGNVSQKGFASTDLALNKSLIESG